VTGRLLAIVNPAAGNGRCGRLAPAALDRLRASGVDVDAFWTLAPGHATELARSARQHGQRRFLVVGGDGTAREVVTGFFGTAVDGPPPQLGLLPLGTGNSFLRDFTERGGVDHAIGALTRGQGRRCDVLRLTIEDGAPLCSINLVGLGLIARIAAMANRCFKALGEFSYAAAACACLARLQTTAVGLRFDEEGEVHRPRSLFVVFSNSRFTGGRLLIAPRASSSDGLIDVLRCAPIGRATIARRFGALYDGSHMDLPFISWRQARQVAFADHEAEDVMVDGDVFRLRCRRLDVLPSALEVLA
jgi:YegS/Rv2252/BmrU family lipid kinase